mmetsp:Transcript_12233/g.36493  ORF Transcript_12233/g.36493 Transcript_12233/m.36493 type:complete len:296 (-) Transcript_12233:619-1506(-)
MVRAARTAVPARPPRRQPSALGRGQHPPNHRTTTPAARAITREDDHQRDEVEGEVKGVHVHHHRQAHEQKNDSVCGHAEHLEEALCAQAPPRAHVGQGVAAHGDSRKERRHDAGEVRHLGAHEGEVGHGPEYGELHGGQPSMAAHAQSLEHEGQRDAHAHAVQNGRGARHHKTAEDCRQVRRGRELGEDAVVENGPEGDEGHSVVEHALPEDEVVELGVHAERAEGGERGHGVHRRDEGCERARLCSGEGHEDLHLAEVVDARPCEENGNESASHREHGDGAQVAEEEELVDREA